MSGRLEEIGQALELDVEASPAETPAEAGDVKFRARGFELDPDGLWHRPPDKDGEQQSRTWLCGPFKVVGLARDGNGDGWSVVVEFLDLDGRLKREIVARREFAGDGAEVRRRLLDRGLDLAASAKARALLQTAFLSLQTSSRVRLEHSTGWKGDLYVLPHRTIGASASEPVLFQGRAAGTYHAEAGSFATWQAAVAGAMVGNPAGVFAISVALAAPLLRELGGEGGGFHLRGQSSRGKSSLQRVAGSVWGGGGELGYSQSWRHTDNALDGVALAHNDCLLCLDEIKVVGEAAGVVAYALATGIMKGRLKSDGDARATPTWRVLILSSGEMSLSDLIRQSRNRDRSYTGQELRLLDVAVDFDAEQGVWERLPDGRTGKGAAAEFSSRLRKLTDEHHGWAGPKFVAAYLADRARLRVRAAELRDAFLQAALQPTDTGQVRRGGERFALVAAAGELAAELGVLPWPSGEAARAVGKVFQRWAAAFGRTQLHEDREAIQRLRDYLQQHEHSNFRVRKGERAAEDELYDLGKGLKPRQGEARSLTAAGWRDDDGGETVFHIFPGIWRAVIFAGINPEAAARSVRAAGYLVSNGKDGRLTNRVSIGNRKESFYSVRAAIMGDDGEFAVPGDTSEAAGASGTEKAEENQPAEAGGSQVHIVPTTSDGEAWGERAAVLEYECGLSREEAERQARAEAGAG